VIAKDATDRNRTSPFAFTGNKFEFRAVGASQPIAVPLTVLNAVVGEALGELNAQVDAQLKSGKDTRAAVLAVVRTAVEESKAVRFDGNNYSAEWRAEAEKRGLPHLKNTIEALHAWELPKAKELFNKSGILSAPELEARTHIRHEQYVKTLNIEAQLLKEMAETQILPAALRDLSDRTKTVERLSAVHIDPSARLVDPIRAQAGRIGDAYARLDALKAALVEAEGQKSPHAQSEAFGTKVCAAMSALRDVLDTIEEACDASLWPLPKYRELLARHI
jgi:glutamine synthetase